MAKKITLRIPSWGPGGSGSSADLGRSIRFSCRGQDLSPRRARSDPDRRASLRAYPVHGLEVGDLVDAPNPGDAGQGLPVRGVGLSDQKEGLGLEDPRLSPAPRNPKYPRKSCLRRCLGSSIRSRPHAPRGTQAIYAPEAARNPTMPTQVHAACPPDLARSAAPAIAGVIRRNRCSTNSCASTSRPSSLSSMPIPVSLFRAS